MALKDLIPHSLFRRDQFPDFWNAADENVKQWLANFPQDNSGLTISEDAKNIYVEAALPGLDVNDLEVTLDKGILWIRGEKKEEKEDKDKKFYRKALRKYSYRVEIPSQINEDKELEAEFKNGIMKISFEKSDSAPAKKVKIKNS